MKPLKFIIATLFMAIMVAIPAGASASDQYPPGYDYTCPTGTYPIGNGVCKNEPSGCPFYENVGEKGCVKPSDIECTDDTWTNCWYVGNTTQPAESTPQPAKTEPTTTTPPASPQATTNAGNAGQTPTAPATNVNETAETVAIDDANVNENDTDTTQSAVNDEKDAQRVDEQIESVGDFVNVYIGTLAALGGLGLTIGGLFWYEMKRPGKIRALIEKITKRR